MCIFSVQRIKKELVPEWIRAFSTCCVLSESGYVQLFLIKSCVKTISSIYTWNLLIC